MKLELQILIELILGLGGFASLAGGFAAWQTAISIRHDLLSKIAFLKSELASVRRRLKLLETFAANNGYCLKDVSPLPEDTDL